VNTQSSPLPDDIVLTHALEWPSLTVQWLPDKKVKEGASFSTQELILGTHTSDDELNFLMVAKVVLPLEDTVIDQRDGNGI
jgi:histone-binding protein RBBP4